MVRDRANLARHSGMKGWIWQSGCCLLRLASVACRGTLKATKIWPPLTRGSPYRFNEYLNIPQVGKGSCLYVTDDACFTLLLDPRAQLTQITLFPITSEHSQAYWHESLDFLISSKSNKAVEHFQRTLRQLTDINGQSYSQNFRKWPGFTRARSLA